METGRTAEGISAVEQVAAVLRHWEKQKDGTNARACPVCRSHGKTLAIHKDDKTVVGICYKCCATARIKRSDLADENKD